MGLLTSGFRVRVPGGPPHYRQVSLLAKVSRVRAVGRSNRLTGRMPRKSATRTTVRIRTADHFKESLMSNDMRIEKMYQLALRLNAIVEEMKSRK